MLTLSFDSQAAEEMFEKLPFHTTPSARTTFRRALVAGDEEKALAAYTAVDARGATLQASACSLAGALFPRPARLAFWPFS